MPPLITLTTDFGTRDPYVASMKGVILSICPSANIVDLSHEIAPQDVFEGALFIAEVARQFPADTIHCVVVDPGVGTTRHPLVARAAGQYFVCPDNGLLTFVENSAGIDESRVIRNKLFLREFVSATFHGRDVFAPAAARLADGTPLADAGELYTDLVQLEVPRINQTCDGIGGEVMHIDRFGNAITNIPRTALAQSSVAAVRCGGITVPRIHETYGNVGPGEALALFGSADYLEIAVSHGSAAATFGLRRGSRVEIGLIA